MTQMGHYRTFGYVELSKCVPFVQVDGYLHNEEEKHYKKIIWEEMNKEYLEVTILLFYFILFKKTLLAFLFYIGSCWSIS